MEQNSKIYVAGHRGLVGSAIVRRLKELGYINLVLRSHAELDLTRQRDVELFFEKERPEYVFLAAAKVGGIWANNTYPADFIYKNLMMQNCALNAAYLYGVRKLLFLGSSCIYPKNCPQPMRDDYLLSGSLEPTNEPYAVAKIAGIKMCQSYNRQHGTNFISVMPTNLYGPNDNFDLETSHVLPALIRKFHEAKMGLSDAQSTSSVVVWGTGNARREFLHVDDLSNACVFLMNHFDGSEIVNIGTGEDISIRDLALLIKKIVGFEGRLIFDSSKPDGTPRKLLDITRLTNLGWKAQISLEEGISTTYEWYRTFGLQGMKGIQAKHCE
jgi:GDP-L-fucose synthase